jgi:hypothetical protein
MPFDKDKFINQATAGGMAESQASFLADQMDLSSSGPADLTALEDRLRGEFDGSIHDVKKDMDERAMLARVQFDDLARDFARMEARVEGTVKSSFTSLRRAHYTSSAFNTLTTFSAVTVLLWWLG